MAPHHKQLVDLLSLIKCQGYQFITTTPGTHEHYLRTNTQANNLRDIFGWNLPFAIELIPQLNTILFDTGMIERCGELWRSRIRISSLGNDLFLHSAFPTTESDAIFFGPDTYRFARFIRHCLEVDKQFFLNNSNRPLGILDIGCGTGAGGITAIRALPAGKPYEITMSDINSTALDLMQANAQASGIPVKLLQGDIIEVLQEKFDLIIANPPFMRDDSGRSYRDGGEQLGLALSIRMFIKAFEQLALGGKLIIYTGVAMTSSIDPFLSAITLFLEKKKCTWSYEEIDPDIFGDELQKPAYAKAHRIAAVGLVVDKPFIQPVSKPRLK